MTHEPIVCSAWVVSPDDRRIVDLDVAGRTLADAEVLAVREAQAYPDCHAEVQQAPDACSQTGVCLLASTGVCRFA